MANADLNRLRPQFFQGFVDGRRSAQVPFNTERHGIQLVDRIFLPDFFEANGLERVDILHCDAQGCELPLLASCAGLIEADRIKFLVISTHAEMISGDYLTHQRCLRLLQELGCSVLVEHDVHESFSGDGLIVAYHGDLPGWRQPAISYNRYSTSLFRNPLFDLALASAHRTAVDK